MDAAARRTPGFAGHRMGAADAGADEADGMFKKITPRPAPPTDDEAPLFTERDRVLLRAELDAQIYRFGSPGLM